MSYIFNYPVLCTILLFSYFFPLVFQVRGSSSHAFALNSLLALPFPTSVLIRLFQFSLLVPEIVTLSLMSKAPCIWSNLFSSENKNKFEDSKKKEVFKFSILCHDDNSKWKRNPTVGCITYSLIPTVVSALWISN